MKKTVIQLTLLVSTISSPLSANQELDYLYARSSKPNIMMIFDASQSVGSPYEGFMTKIDPFANPGHPDSQKLNGYLNDLRSTLRNTGAITPSARIIDRQYCDSSESFGEGDYTCTTTTTQWTISKLDLVLDVLRDLTLDLKGANVAYMRTSINADGFVDYKNNRDPARIRTFDSPANDNNGAFVVKAFTEIESINEARAIADVLQKNQKDDPTATSPIAESLYEAYMYFTGQRSPWTKNKGNGWEKFDLDLLDSSATQGVAYKSPLNECSSNHVVYFTDGAPVWDWHANSYIDILVSGKNVSPAGPVPRTSSWNWTCSNDPAGDKTAADTRLDELAGYLANYDVDTSIAGKQTIKTHFVSTWPDCESPEILDTATAASGGFHIPIDNMNELRDALQKIIDSIMEEGPGPVVGLNTTFVKDKGNPFATDTHAYVNAWEHKSGIWTGNLKKYKVGENGRLLDKNNANLILPEGGINTSSRSLWSNAVDGESVTQGGAAAKLSGIYQNRYTLTGSISSGQQIKSSPNLLSPGNNNLVIPNASPEERLVLLQWAGGMDTQDIDGDTNLTEPRQSLGDSLNTKPVVAHYSIDNADSVVFVASNEGYLHAFDAETGEHLYSFMPPEFLPRLQSFQDQTSEKAYGVDGTLMVYHEDLNKNPSLDAGEKLFLFFGMRRGGTSYYALDITEKNNPKLAWRISADQAGFAQLGESWGSPEILTIPWTSNTTKTVVAIGGGYDTSYDTNMNPAKAKGSELYFIDLHTGELISKVNNASVPAMVNSIINKPVSLDLNLDGIAESLFFNDIRGAIFRCDIEQSNSQFKSEFNCGLQAQSQASNGRLLFTNPLDIALIKPPQVNSAFLSLALASGNRMNPADRVQRNRLVNFIMPLSQVSGDNKTIESIAFTDLKNYSQANQDESNRGWYFEFPDTGEKALSQTLIINDVIHFSTFVPNDPSAQTNVCESSGVGISKLYSMKVFDGSKLDKADSIMRWKGPSNGLPDSPDAVLSTGGQSDVSYSINIGVNNTAIEEQIKPLSRNYWYEE